MGTRMTSSRAVLVALFSLLFACNQGGDGKQAPAEGKAPTDEAAEGSGDPCADYAKKLCEVLGEQTSTCAAARETTGVMPPAACKAGLADVAFTRTRAKEMAKSCPELMKRLCKDVGEDTQSCAMVKAQTPSFPPERCNSMLAQYDKVLADLKQREEANKPLTPEKMTAITENAVATFGPEQAKVTVVEFSDFQCPYCSRAANAVSDIKKRYEGKDVRFVFRHFPLSFHQQAHLAAQASLAAAAQGKFWQFHDELFANQKALQRPDLEAHAQKLGLDMAAFKKALDDKSHAETVDADLKLGELVAVSGTPTMFVNGQRVANPGDANAVAAMIDAELAK